MSTEQQASTTSKAHHPSSFAGLLTSVINAGRDILDRRRKSTEEAPSGDLLAKCHQLIHHRGEASGLALACEVIADYQALDQSNQLLFFQALAQEFSADREAILTAAEDFESNPDSDQLAALVKATEAPRVKLFRRMNMAPSATPVLVKMRGDLLGYLQSTPSLKPVDSDLKHQFISWFNRGSSS